MRFPARRILAPPLYALAAAAALAAGWAATAAPATAAPAATTRAASPALTAPAADAGAPALRAALAARAAAATPLLVITSRGDTLSGIAAVTCTRRFWPEIWWANRRKIHNPNVLPAHLALTVPACHAARPAHVAAALAAIPPPPPPPAPQAPPAPGAAAAAPAPAAAPPPPAATGSVTPSSAYEACVIANESGGNAGAVNASSGAGGLYQFLPSTWASLGYSGLPQDASPATQQAAFNRLYAQSGSAPWSSDGCG